MPEFGDYQSDTSLFSREEGRDVFKIWLATKQGDATARQYIVKSLSVRGGAAPPGTVDGLGRDHTLEFLEGVKAQKKALEAGGRGLAPIHDFGHSDDGVWYATDCYYRGSSIASVHAFASIRGEVSHPELRHLVSELAAGCLSLKRSRGYSHGNLKAANVFRGGSKGRWHQHPVFLADPYPAGGARHLDPQNIEMLGRMMEIEDLRGIGEIILQLVAGKLIVRGEYNWPLTPAPNWKNWKGLGKHGEHWLTLCNELLNPNPSLDRLNLDSLEKTYAGGSWFGGLFRSTPKAAPTSRPPDVAQPGEQPVAAPEPVLAPEPSPEPARPRKPSWIKRHWLKVAGATAVVLLVAAAAVTVKKWSENQYADSIGRAEQALAGGNFQDAYTWGRRAEKKRPADENAKELIAKAEAGLYATAMAAGNAALGRQDWAAALLQAAAALKLKPKDAGALALQEKADAGQKAVVQTQEQGTKYQAAIAAVEAAWQRKDYAQVMAQAQEALKWKGKDAVAEAWLNKGRMERDYATAMAAGNAALGRQDWAAALLQAEAALKLKPKDVGALALQEKADAGQQAVVQAQQREAKYQAAITAAEAAWQRKDYAEVMVQAQEALKLKEKDSKAEEWLRRGQVERDYTTAITTGNEALKTLNWETAGSRAVEALKAKPNDPDAVKLQTAAAEGRTREQRLLAELEQLITSPENWGQVNEKLKQEAALAKKPAFQSYFQWLAENSPCARLDNQLMILNTRYGIPKKDRFNGHVDVSGVTQRSKSAPPVQTDSDWAKNSEQNYKQSGCVLDSGRQDNLRKLRATILNWSTS